ncbi:MAG TPA: hypothetical protein PK819_00870 [Thermomicrobiales bacterium]|nr:hypothetical protein [Thermomicrobiales bacterium]
MSEPRDRDREYDPGYRGTTGRLQDTYRPRAEPDTKKRNQGQFQRQIISGADVPPPSRTGSGFTASSPALTQPQMTYAAALGVLLIFGVLLWLVFGMGVASIIFFLLALGLLGGWLAF